MSLITDIKAIQRAVGAEVDGVFGPITADRTLRTLQSFAGIEPKQLDQEAAVLMDDGPFVELDARSVRTIGTLDAKARDSFYHFLACAKATAATLGCDYIAISGTRSLAKQAELYQAYKAGGPKAARPGYSWHNFGIAVDFGVFQGNASIYCDDRNPELAQRVHAACAVHAKACGLEWGGQWKGRSCDPPHYQIDVGHSSPSAADRTRYRNEGSVL